MIFSRWRVGLSYEHNRIFAVAIQRYKTGWRLCHWWRYRLRPEEIAATHISPSSCLIQSLQAWRKQLPRYISLRLGIEPQWVMQRTLPLPGLPLTPHEKRTYIQTAAKRLFPLDYEQLTLDYREYGGVIWVTAIPQKRFRQWLLPFQQADIRPCIIELLPNALAVVGDAMQMPEQATWIHAFTHGWLSYTPGAAKTWEFNAKPFSPQTFTHAKPLWLSGLIGKVTGMKAHLPNPLSLFNCDRSVNPLLPSSYTLACGLALREKESLWYE